MDLPGLAEVLRKLSPRQEKVTRMYYGWGANGPTRLGKWPRNSAFPNKSSRPFWGLRSGGWRGKG